MPKIMISPRRYVQGPGEINNLGMYTKKIGSKGLILISTNGYKRSGEFIENSFAKAECGVIIDYFNGECSKDEIERVREVIKKNSCDVVVGFGGGKILDTAKAAAYYENLPVIICPTQAGTDAPCSALSVIYTPTGEFDEYLFLPHNPDLVLVDSDIIANSPLRVTVSGMGDALATFFEARASIAAGKLNFCAGEVTLVARAICKLCYETLLAEGEKAKIAIEAGVRTEAVERIIEANTLMSGLGFESGGVAAAHAVHNGLTELEECHHMYHGEKVSFGVITQLVLENAPMEELEEVINFCIAVGLPITLEQLGVKEITDEKIKKVAKGACVPTETSHNMPFDVTEETMAAAIYTAQALGKLYLSKAEK